MKYKVAELQGVPLDAAVAKAKGDEPGAAYSSDWSHGGPVIGRELIFFSELPQHEGGPEVMAARCGRAEGRGRGHLISAMRAYVTDKFGETVELP